MRSRKSSLVHHISILTANLVCGVLPNRPVSSAPLAATGMPEREANAAVEPRNVRRLKADIIQFSRQRAQIQRRHRRDVASFFTEGSLLLKEAREDFPAGSGQD